MLKKMLVQGLVAAAIIGGGAAAYSAMAEDAAMPQAPDGRTAERMAMPTAGDTGYLKPDTRAGYAAKKDHRRYGDHHEDRKHRPADRKRSHDRDDD